MDANRNFSAGVVDSNAMSTIGLAQGELARIDTVEAPACGWRAGRYGSPSTNAPAT